MKQFNNILHIDTRENDNIIVRLNKNGEVLEEKSIANKDRAQATLPLIAKVLSRAKMKSSEINEIKVEKGPGSYTGLRVGISIANALSFGTQAKINGRKIGDVELPEY